MGSFRMLQRVSRILALAGVLSAMGLIAPAWAQEPNGTLVIHIEDVSPKGGILRLGLYDEARYPDDDSAAILSADVKAEPGRTTVTLNNVPPGTYAIQAYQDINSNDKMDTSWLGFPQEPFGFSRDAKPRLSKPRFSAVKFEVAPGVNTQILHLQNSVSLIATN
ncbi:MAG TPA: DUF2141 domain-containing protein [Rhizomicrobium sp.]|nr:DUF2141 domain-containing protein [Rhizomicrobium sp.]